MTTRHISKGQVLQSKGELNSRIYKVQSGLLRSYTLDGKGKMHIYMFGPEGWVVADPQPPQVPCELYIDALEDTTVQVLEKDISRELENIPELLKHIATLQKRIIMLMSASALERYQYFTNTYPQMVQRVPQWMIASYLGITPETLSTVKNKVR